MSSTLQQIQRFVVLMLENRSFDHLVGFLNKANPRIEGPIPQACFNYRDPNTPTPPPVPVSPNAEPVLPFDPNHEFCDVQTQLYGPDPAKKCTDPLGPCCSLPARHPAPMSGFVANGIIASIQQTKQDYGALVMACFDNGQVPYLHSLAQEFALFNFWHSALPGPTWPNRFFVHAATSGGLTDSPGTEAIVEGFSFRAQTIYHALSAAGKEWRIYHDGLPQTAGIDSLRFSYVDPFTRNFREMKHFAHDVKAGNLPEYTFIEPRYDSGQNYAAGNSMHPVNGVSDGDCLVRDVYEALRASASYWPNTMLIITFDEHGGFYDHVPPPGAVPTGDDQTYSNANHKFGFDLYGVRVPAIVVSAYTQKGTVIGQDAGDPATRFDHTSILATVEKRFGLAPLTNRDRAANTLEAAINLAQARQDAPATLQSPTQG